MPDPKKKSLDDLVTEAGNEVLGRNDSKTPPKSSMSEEELLATFGESEKKNLLSLLLQAFRSLLKRRTASSQN